MATKLYIAEPKISAFTADPNSMTLCYAVYEWVQGSPALLHVPCSDEGRVDFTWGTTFAQIRDLVIASLLSFFPDATSNDIIFLGGWN